MPYSVPTVTREELARFLLADLPLRAPFEKFAARQRRQVVEKRRQDPGRLAGIGCGADEVGSDRSQDLSATDARSLAFSRGVKSRRVRRLHSSCVDERHPLLPPLCAMRALRRCRSALTRVKGIPSRTNYGPGASDFVYGGSFLVPDVQSHPSCYTERLDSALRSVVPIPVSWLGSERTGRTCAASG